MTKQSNENQANVINVTHEWGTLKEVILGRPFTSMPEVLPPYLKNWLSDDAYATYEAMAGSTLEETYPVLYAKQLEQIEGAKKVLHERGIKIHQIDKLPEHELNFGSGQVDSLHCLQYMRDSVVVIGNNFIETNMYDPGRRSERFAIRRALGDRLKNSNARVVSMPEPPVMSDENGFGEGAFLEGGDVFVLGKTILVGNTGNASNKEGIEWLQQYLGNEYDVIEVPLSNDFVHLDCVLCTMRPGLGLIVEEAFLEGIPAILRDWDFVQVDAKEAEGMLATNAFVLDNKTVMMSASLPHIAEAVRAHNHEVIEVPFDSIQWQGGAFRCWHHPLIRVTEA
ncbi:arginine deiminase family protein [Vibrio sp. 10N.261.51.F12]|uniref:arginine deiminase family protein n=1 Tax=Vibrio sp. 10N.261.51.F12 TaxID=3229679 RepID=UPI00354DFC76